MKKICHAFCEFSSKVDRFVKATYDFIVNDQTPKPSNMNKKIRKDLLIAELIISVLI